MPVYLTHCLPASYSADIKKKYMLIKKYKMFLNFTCRNELCDMMFTCAFNQVFHGFLFRFLICFFLKYFFVQVILQILYGCCERLFNLCMKMHFARPPLSL